ncbi:MAG: hypothetical protein CMM02_18400 [Rhodopirellula sp.]|nr:hypothetical protein [Rhodopirellula sp.]MAT12971.1 hypothetical protein [Rhodopirellula sp.]|tara:strand:+ start:19632 stop:21692 length:2061 start_codon:yes stop_codon:yes gene_type:complete
MATGLEVYESTMRPVRDAVQGIFAQQEKRRTERNAERQKIEAEERAEQRQIKSEARAEAGAIRKEDRVERRLEKKAMDKSKAIARSLGVPTTGTRYEIDARVSMHMAKLPDQEWFSSNMDVLPSILKDPEMISAIEAGALSKGELKAIRARVEGSVKAQRGSDAAAFNRTTPEYIRKRDGAAIRYTNNAKRITDIQSGYYRDQARDSLDNPNIAAALAEAGLLTTQIPNEELEEVFEDYPELKSAFAQSPTLVMLDQIDIGSGGERFSDMSSDSKTILKNAYDEAQKKIADRKSNDFNSKYLRRELAIKEQALQMPGIQRELSDLLTDQRKLQDDYPELHYFNASKGTYNFKGSSVGKSAIIESGETGTETSDAESTDVGTGAGASTGGSSTSDIVARMRAAAANTGSNTAATPPLTSEQANQIAGQTFLTAGDTPASSDAPTGDTTPAGEAASTGDIAMDQLAEFSSFNPPPTEQSTQNFINSFARRDTPNSILTSEQAAVPQFSTKELYNRQVAIDNEIDSLNNVLATLPSGQEGRSVLEAKLASLTSERNNIDNQLREQSSPSGNLPSQSDMPVNLGPSNIGMTLPPMSETSYPPGYEQNVKQVQSQIGQAPPMLGNFSPVVSLGGGNTGELRNYMRPPAPPYVAPITPTRPPTPQTPATPFNPFGEQTNPFRQETNPFFIPR